MGSRSTAACALVVFRERMDAVQIVAAAVLLAGLGVLLARPPLSAGPLAEPFQAV